MSTRSYKYVLWIPFYNTTEFSLLLEIVLAWSYREDLPKLLGKTPTQECKTPTSGWCVLLKNVFAEDPY